MYENADIVIIGGGAIGVSIAYHLALHRPGRIVLLERDSLGSGSTGLSVASIDGLTLRPHAAPMFANSTRFFAGADEQLGAPCGFERTGSILLAGADNAAGVETAVSRMRAAGINSELLSLQDLAELESEMMLEEVTAVALTPEAGYADPVLTTQAFAGAARRLGVTIRQGEEVRRLLIAGERVAGVETAVGFINAPVVVVAAGPWSGSLLRHAGIGLPLQPVLHPVVCLRRPPRCDYPRHSLLDLTTGIYARPESGNLTLLGSIDPAVGYDPTSGNGRGGYVEESYIIWTMERLVRRYPALEASELLDGWAGIMTITPDWQPVIGGWSRIPGLFCAVGFSGQGFQICPAVGDYMARLVAGDLMPSEPLAAFAPGRFVAGRSAPAAVGLLGHAGSDEEDRYENR